MGITRFRTTTTMDDPDVVLVAAYCPFCKSHKKLSQPVLYNDWHEWQNGEPRLIHDQFPYLNAEDREQILTGVCPPCWDSMWD